VNKEQAIVLFGAVMGIFIGLIGATLHTLWRLRKERRRRR
jgi:hypothetical protein